jgi:hypothetical protein
MSPISIDIHQFSSKKAAEDHVRALINRLSARCIHSASPEFDFFLTLLEKHHDYKTKAGAGVDGFLIAPNPMSSKCMAMYSMYVA